jgi:hypothetical protein
LRRRADASPDPAFSLLATRRDASLGNEKLFVKCAKKSRNGENRFGVEERNRPQKQYNKGGTVIETAFRGQEGFLLESKSRSFKMETES